MTKNRTEPNYALLGHLEQARIEELRAERGTPTGTITVSLDLETKQASVEEDWFYDIDEEQRIWLTVFAAACAVLRYAAHFPAPEIGTMVRKIAQGRAAHISDWSRHDEMEFQDASFEMQLLGAPGKPAPGGYLIIDLPEALSELEMLEPIAILRKYFTTHRDPVIARASTLAFENLASRAGRDELHAVDLADQLTLQFDVPVNIMFVLEAAGRVPPFLTRRKSEWGNRC